ncbi:Tubulin/FtsZ, GTPase domain-containing protein [Mycena capillaripes]|nr:Tubulin/FtsZ, GTPase domain-containing protein [Mycena capillaripes]
MLITTCGPSIAHLLYINITQILCILPQPSSSASKPAASVAVGRQWVAGSSAPYNAVPAIPHGRICARAKGLGVCFLALHKPRAGELYTLKHVLSPDGCAMDGSPSASDSGFSMFFSETGSETRVPRSIYIDLEPERMLPTILSNHELIDPVMDKIRRFSDNCSGLCSLFVFHSFAGFGALLLERLSTDYGKKSKLEFCV